MTVAAAYLTRSGSDPFLLGISLAVWSVAFSRTRAFKASEKAAKVATLRRSSEKRIDHCGKLSTSFKMATMKNVVCSTTLIDAKTTHVDNSRQLRVPNAATVM
jgi:hypothetical protein